MLCIVLGADFSAQSCELIIYVRTKKSCARFRTNNKSSAVRLPEERAVKQNEGKGVTKRKQRRAPAQRNDNKKKEQRCALAFSNNNKKMRCAHVVRTKRQRCALVRSPLRPNEKTALCARQLATHKRACTRIFSRFFRSCIIVLYGLF